MLKKSELNSMENEGKAGLLARPAFPNILALILVSVLSYSGLVMTSNAVLKVTMAPVTLTFFQFTGTAILSTLISKAWQLREKQSDEKTFCTMCRGGIMLCGMYALRNNAYFLSSATFVELCFLVILPLLLTIDTYFQRETLLRHQLQRRMGAIVLTIVAAFVALLDSNRLTDYGPMFTAPAVVLPVMYFGYMSRQLSDTLHSSTTVAPLWSIDDIACMSRGGSVVLFGLMILSERLRMPDEPYFPSQLIVLSIVNIVLFALCMISVQYLLYCCKLSVLAALLCCCHVVAAVFAAFWVDTSLSSVESSYIVIIIGVCVTMVLWDS